MTILEWVNLKHAFVNWSLSDTAVPVAVCVVEAEGTCAEGGSLEEAVTQWHVLTMQVCPNLDGVTLRTVYAVCSRSSDGEWSPDTINRQMYAFATEGLAREDAERAKEQIRANGWHVDAPKVQPIQVLTGRREVS